MSIVTAVRMLAEKFGKKGKKGMHHISPFEEPKGKANKEVKDKREMDAEVEATIRELKMNTAKRQDRDARQLGSDKSKPVKEGGGLNSNPQREYEERTSELVSPFDSDKKQELVDKASREHRMEKGSIGRYKRNLQEAVKAVSKAKRLKDLTAYKDARKRVQTLTEKISDLEQK